MLPVYLRRILLSFSGKAFAKNESVRVSLDFEQVGTNFQGFTGNATGR